MNRSLYEYCLGSSLRWWNRPRAAEARSIHALLRKAIKTGTAIDRQVLIQLRTLSTIDGEVFRLLRPLHGCGGSEGSVLDVDPQEEADFWVSLAARFPEHQGIGYIAADATLLAEDHDNARRHFIQTFRLDRDTCSPFAADWEELQRGTNWHFEYRLHSLLRTQRDHPEEARDEARFLRQEVGGDPDKLRMIESVAQSGQVPRMESTSE